MQQTIIEPKKSVFHINFKEIYAYRELLWTLTYRDIRVKYAQTALGMIWALVNPVFTLLVLSFVFGKVAKVDTGGIPHLLYTNAGLVGWTYFAAMMTSAGSSILGAQAMIKKIYFPRLVIPLSKAITSFIDFGVIMLIMFVLMIYYQFMPPSSFVFLPFFILMAVISGLAGGIWISALTIRYRDFTQIVPLVMRVGMYATPIAYPASLVPEKYLFFYYLNPMAGVVEGMRWSIVGGPSPHAYAYFSFALVTLLFISSVFYFRKVERVMADIL